MVEVDSGPTTHTYTLTLPDRLRSRHFAFAVDRSVCLGSLLVNGQKLLGDDADEIFRFDRSNLVRLEGCLERTPKPIALFAHPKVLIHGAFAEWSPAGRQLRVRLELRNTLANSVSVTIESRNIPALSRSFFLGPQTSQTYEFFERLAKQEAVLELEMWKHEEAIEGAYRHIRSVAVSRKQ